MRVDGNESIGLLFEKLLESAPVVCEELIVQSKGMSILNASSVNTVRMPAISCNGGVRLLAPFLRIGRQGSVVDNAGAGGVFATVDEKTGIVTTLGIDERGRSYVKHPESGVVIPGFQVPRWHEAVALVNDLADSNKEVRYVGWDLALTEDGWVVVEGNDNGQMLGQMPDKTGKRQILEELIAAS